MKIGPLTVSPYQRRDHIKSCWYFWACEIEWPDGRITQGELQGDGGLFAPETLTDEDGEPIVFSAVTT